MEKHKRGELQVCSPALSPAYILLSEPKAASLLHQPVPEEGKEIIVLYQQVKYKLNTMFPEIAKQTKT